MRKMKDSGTEWIGEIPEHWEVKRNKQLFYEVDNRCENGNDFTLLSVSEYTGVTPRSEVIKEGEFETHAQSLDGYKICIPGDIVMNIMLAWKRATAVSKYNGIVSPAYTVYRGIDIDTRYYHYLFRTDLCADMFKRFSTGIIDSRLRLYPDVFLSLYTICPPLAEQSLIANYLDTECSRIDAVIEQTRASIEEYKKLKQSVITQAVTKGIRPNRKMKDSGIEWIGEIPEEWDAVRLQFIINKIESGTSVNAGQNPAGKGEIGVLKTSSVSKNVFISSENKSVNQNELSRVSCPVKGDTIIVSRMNTPELVGACGYVTRDYDNLFLPDRLWQVHFINGVNVKYVYYWLISDVIRGYYSSLAVGTSSSMQNISQDQFYHARCPLPEQREQESIVKYLDLKCERVSALISEKEKLLNELETYKKSLIYEYVTGKKEVQA